MLKKKSSWSYFTINVLRSLLKFEQNSLTNFRSRPPFYQNTPWKRKKDDVLAHLESLSKNCWNCKLVETVLAEWYVATWYVKAYSYLQITHNMCTHKYLYYHVNINNSFWKTSNKKFKFYYCVLSRKFPSLKLECIQRKFISR